MKRDGIPGQSELDALADALPVGIFLTDTAGRCLAANERWCALLELPREAALGEGWLQVVHPEDRERVLAECVSASCDTERFTSEFRLQPPDGTVRHVFCRGHPVHDSDGQFAALVVTAFDVTERHQTETALRETAQELEKRVREIDCLFEISRIVERSGGSLPVILRGAAEILPRSWRHSEVAYARIVMDGESYQTANYADTPWKQHAQILIDDQSVGEIEVGYLEERPTADEGPFLKEETNLLGAIAARLGRSAERLLTRQLLRENETELRERMTHLTRVSTMGEMASSIAHEVNQPLTAIATYAQACRRLVEVGRVESAELQEVLNRISDEALRAGNIIHRLRDLVRRRESRWVECDINHLVRDVEELALVDARMHDVDLHFELEPNLPLVVADGVQVQQVVLNLIRNGIDAVGESDSSAGEVVLRTGVHGADEVGVSVRDNGCGLAEDAEEKLFQPFFTTKKGGMGMGLSISRSIVTSHGGRIWFSRNADPGATFFFTLPIADNS